ncbi:MAG: DUF1684 domain-containing protein [Melioribacteraceae bacterium]|nr:DUF1684 domain-containing protein [Melioribacteraceae bacterium]
MMKRIRKIVLTILIALFMISCTSKYSPEEEKYIEEIEAYREHKDSLMQFASNSPFNFKEKVEFHPLNYFDVKPKFVFKSKLHKYENPDTITIYGTQGEPRETIRYGYLPFTYNDTLYNLNVYKTKASNDAYYYGIWFTDRTTNNETYGVGRYLDFEYVDEPDHIYTLDFNLAYNPYCAYSSAYSCAIPTKEDYLDLTILAGEKNFHD